MARYTVNAGDMRTQITLQNPTISTDAGAAQTTSYANASTNPIVYARWINAHGNEVVNSSALETVQRAVVTIRHRTDIRETWRVLKDSEPWQILSIDAVQGKRRWIEMIVERTKGSA